MAEKKSRGEKHFYIRMGWTALASNPFGKLSLGELEALTGSSAAILLTLSLARIAS